MKQGRTQILSSVVGVAVATCSQLTMAGGTPLTTVRVASGIGIPVVVTYAPGDFDRVFIAVLDGRIWILKDGVVLGTPFLDIDSLTNTGGESGLLGLAFHPNYANNGFFYVNYINTNNDTTIARYQVSAANPDVADPGSAEILLDVDQPFLNHNGGWMDFGPKDGFLYIALGDGGGSDAGQLGSVLLGKMLRINVDGALPYEIPADNPFIDDSNVLDEIWALGLRNPWRNSFDRETGDLYIGDVGDSGNSAWEEINIQPGNSRGGENYGWRCMEGFDCTGESGCTCNSPDLTLPKHVYEHANNGCAVVGGVVYRGCAIPDLAGTYFFADFCSATLWSLRFEGGQVLELTDRTSELEPPGSLDIRVVPSFGEDAYGEIYICDLLDAEVFKIVPDTDGPLNDCNANGIEDGCEIMDGSAADDNGNGIPDECEEARCEGDANGDGTVDPLDAGFVLSRLGCPVGAGDPNCDAADQNGDGIVDPLDVGFVLARMGSCD